MLTIGFTLDEDHYRAGVDRTIRYDVRPGLRPRDPSDARNRDRGHAGRRGRLACDWGVDAVIGMEPAHLLVGALDLVGTFVFALSGGALGVQRGLDLFGILVLAFVTAAVGGITRDVLIGAIPPASIASWHALALSVVGGLLVFQFSDLVTRFKRSVLLFDAAGLGVFAIAGTTKALDHGIDWPMAAVLGMLSGIGGGIVRDTLTAQVPTVLRSEIYGLAALAGALTVVAGSACGLPATPVGLTGIALCVFLRLMSLFRSWKLPSPRALGDDATDRGRGGA